MFYVLLKYRITYYDQNTYSVIAQANIELSTTRHLVEICGKSSGRL